MEDASSNTIGNYANVSPTAAPSGSSNNSSSAYYGNTPRMYGRQILSGNIRGNQNITGVLTMVNPTTNNPVITIDGTSGLIDIGNSASSTTGSSSVSSNASGNLGINISGATNSINMGINNNEAQLLFNDGSVNRLLVGQDSSGTQVIWITPPGTEVTTSTLAQRSFDSSASFVVVASNTYTFPSMSVGAGLTAWATSQVIPHGLVNITPAISCYAPLEVGGASLPVYPPDFPTTPVITFIPNGGLIYQGTDLFMSVCYGVDGTNIYLGMQYLNDLGTTEILLGAPVTYYVYSYGV